MFAAAWATCLKFVLLWGLLEEERLPALLKVEGSFPSAFRARIAKFRHWAIFDSGWAGLPRPNVEFTALTACFFANFYACIILVGGLLLCFAAWNSFVRGLW